MSSIWVSSLCLRLLFSALSRFCLLDQERLTVFCVLPLCSSSYALTEFTEEGAPCAAKVQTGGANLQIHTERETGSQWLELQTHEMATVPSSSLPTNSHQQLESADSESGSSSSIRKVFERIF